MQLEVAQRIVAKPSTKQYGILSVVFQLYTRPQVLFQIPPTVFYPQPSVTSALISLDFTGKEGVVRCVVLAMGVELRLESARD